MEKIKKFLRDKNAQSGGVITFVAAICLFSFVYICFGMFMDQVITMQNEMDFPCTQERKDSLEICFMYWYVLPIVVLLGLVVWIIKNALKAKSGWIE